MWNISLQGVIHLGVVLVVAIFFHFMYILTIPTDVKLLKHLSDWALGQLTHTTCTKPAACLQLALLTEQRVSCHQWAWPTSTWCTIGSRPPSCLV